MSRRRCQAADRRDRRPANPRVSFGHDRAGAIEACGCWLLVAGCWSANQQQNYRTANQLKLPTPPVAPFVSITTRITCLPAPSATPRLLIVVHACHPPVFGIVSGPVLSTPFTSM